MTRLRGIARTVSRRCATAVFVFAALSCGDDGTTGPGGSSAVPAVAQEFTGNNQQATVGTTRAGPLVVEVLTSAGVPVGGVSVAFAITTGGGTLSPGDGDDE